MKFSDYDPPDPPEKPDIIGLLRRAFPPGPGRDPERIGPFLEEFKALWEKHPDQRFGQLVANLANSEDAFYWEEDRWMSAIKEYEL